MYDIEYRKKLEKVQRTAPKGTKNLVAAVRKFRQENPNQLMSCRRCGRICVDHGSDLCGFCWNNWVDQKWSMLKPETIGNLKYYLEVEL